MGSRILTHNLGYPRVGAHRQLKKSLEAYWRGKETEADLQKVASDLRRTHWLLQKEAGIDLIPSNDFSFYDHVLDTSAMVGAVPDRFNWKGANIDLQTYFVMARGTTEDQSGGDEHSHCNHGGVHAMEMTKWFDTNYHYIVPEFYEGKKFTLASSKIIDEFEEALQLGITTKPVILGPVTFLKLGKIHGESFDRYELIPALLEVYVEVLRRLTSAGAEWVQFDEPAFGLDLTASEQALLLEVYARLNQAAPALKFVVATYFNDLGQNLATFARLPAHALHLDATRSGEEIDQLLELLQPDQILSLGLVSGRNIWRNDYQQSLKLISRAVAKLGDERLWIAPSCSLLFAPFSLRFEQKLNPEIKSWLAFAEEKLTEISELRQAHEGNSNVVVKNRLVIEGRKSSALIHKSAIKSRCAKIVQSDLKRQSPYAKRIEVQRQHLKLPDLPTTTIGSFPQTEEVRSARAQYRKEKITEAEYEAFLQDEISRVIGWQDEIGLDVLVHGEFERTDMVEYFGEQLSGFVFTENGWVQSYGSRCVKPPILFGDVERTQPMTVRWSKFAQAQTKKPMKGMLTGPITILQWSFVRDDQPRAETARQIALAILDEVRDLEAAGISVIQVDEPALREGLPLRRADWKSYLRWAVDAFRLATAGVADRTQIHTHMCYCEFNDIIEAIAELDADVISMESSRSEMELLEAFRTFKYPNDIGPGVW
ncbi:MAG: 5-methyltetrahydropteroyltriglutamate--homocysteine S-methyltransferase, partial [Verrucomicrobia bacterium]|nr:5-methyltetrahydropteroyltriglutamate--homocysteine S-methyltransferase [Verrucomicrobiota bacterium]